MNRWSSHRIVPECSEHRCKGFRRGSGVNLVFEGALRRRLGNRFGRHDAAAVAGTGGQDPVVAQEMEPGQGDQSRQLLQQFHRREQEMAGPIRPRRPVTPGDQLRLEVEVLWKRRNACRVAGRAFVGEDLVAEAEMMAAPGDMD